MKQICRIQGAMTNSNNNKNQTEIPAVEKMAMEHARKLAHAAELIGDKVHDACDIWTVEKIASKTGLLPSCVVEVWSAMRRKRK
jgi:hypothetical protein